MITVKQSLPKRGIIGTMMIKVKSSFGDVYKHNQGGRTPPLFVVAEKKGWKGIRILIFMKRAFSFKTQKKGAGMR